MSKIKHQLKRVDQLIELEPKCLLREMILHLAQVLTEMTPLLLAVDHREVILINLEIQEESLL